MTTRNQPCATSLRRAHAAFLALACAATMAQAQGVASTDSPGAQKVLDKLTKQIPATRVDSVTESPIKGLYEVVMGKNIAYVDEDATYFVFGHVFDIKKQRDLTQERIAGIAQVPVDFAKLPTDMAIKKVIGKPKTRVAVFSDPSCGYCKKWEQQLATMKDVEVHTYIVGMLGPQSIERAQNVWCAPDRSAAWHAWMVKGVEPPKASDACASTAPVNKLNSLAKSIGVEGTPTFVAMDGRRKPGTDSAADVQAWLDQPAVAKGK